MVVGRPSAVATTSWMETHPRHGKTREQSRRGQSRIRATFIHHASFARSSTASRSETCKGTRRASPRVSGEKEICETFRKEKGGNEQGRGRPKADLDGEDTGD